MLLVKQKPKKSSIASSLDFSYPQVRAVVSRTMFGDIFYIDILKESSMYTIKRTSFYTLLLVSTLATGCLGKLEEEALETLKKIQKTAQKLEEKAEKSRKELEKINKNLEGKTNKLTQ